ncbi:MAG: UDP-N-acetylmuramoyl-tripeptide--D-alanyl-D-alanine ligase [Anaerolineae bacterium]|nr:UDP-N-acetylmuramoyl-tripeptide--D-alanyl-D-alanine ligase [Anaerolineae bacterium]
MVSKNALTLNGILSALKSSSSLGDAGARQITSVVVDSRQAVSGSVFVALPGERTDGHLYVLDAFERGAVAAIVQEKPDMPGDLNQPHNQPPPLSSSSLRREDAAQVKEQKRGGDFSIVDVGQDQVPEPISLPVCLLVRDSLVALQKLAIWWCAQFDVRVVGITGSVGKTTSKELIASVLSQRYCVLKSKASYNNEIGLPLTLLELGNEHEYIILEMGTYGPGEITQLASIVRPHIGVVTNVGPVHLERMGTIECIAEAKSELPQALAEDGVAILNGDDRWVRPMAHKTQARVFFYGLTPECDLWADQVESHGLEGLHFRFHYQSETIHAQVPLLGQHSVHTSLRAAAVGLVEGLSWEEIIRGLHTGEQLRLVVVQGINDSTLLDDTYNSSPDSAIAALNLLDDLEGRKIAVLGDMLELGGYEVEGHRRVGRRAMDVVSILITVGELGQLIGKWGLHYGMPPEKVIHVRDNEAAIVCLKDLIQKGDVVLIKGSRGMQMEQIVDALTSSLSNGSSGQQAGD